MIHIIYGAKGTGKTKQIIDSANSSAENSAGVVVYIDKDSTRMHDLVRKVRLVDAVSYGIDGQKCFLAFIKGMLACNFDIEKIHIDGSAKIVSSKIEDMQVFYDGIVDISNKFNVDFVITASCDKEQLPEFVSKLI